MCGASSGFPRPKGPFSWEKLVTSTALTEESRERMLDLLSESPEKALAMLGRGHAAWWIIATVTAFVPLVVVLVVLWNAGESRSWSFALLLFSAVWLILVALHGREWFRRYTDAVNAPNWRDN